MHFKTFSGSFCIKTRHDVLAVIYFVQKEILTNEVHVNSWLDSQIIYLMDVDNSIGIFQYIKKIRNSSWLLLVISIEVQVMW